MQRITLIGNLTHDPETRSTPNGVTVCSFTIAVNRRFSSQSGGKQTDFFRINAWRQMGDACARYLSKGKKSRGHRRAAGPYLYGQGRHHTSIIGRAGGGSGVFDPETQR